ncbi:sulfatase-like hydrolase/transferase [Pseudoduganella sp. FT25W]|uniref:Sulfatase-like hydrolase/transferase n=2 Tax=Duganella alba TaxID=2666081 RepID=A0A6L5QFU6_9BURK|nr:sulfatase-like hydrolase/transferase [Duganella alba]MRX08408.1 sulfatase-like hydrolase/transferase [Duganella alba]MRX17118.1 sulfatase-like hydrolase/transferase [Duganella alba]
MKIALPSVKTSGSRLMRSSMYLLGIFLFCFSYWLHRSFGKPDIEQITYHMNFGVELMNTVDPAVTHRFFRWCVLAPLVFFALLCYMERRGRGVVARRSQRCRAILSRMNKWFPLLVVFSATMFWMCDVSAFKYLTSDFGPDYFAANYVPPRSVPLVAQKPKNLILIYVESLEQGYAERKVFGHDLLAPLTDLHGASFSSYEQVPGTGWTIAAVVATQCGVPLERVTLFDPNTQGQVINNFMKNAVCLPDLLAEQGYRNVFMGGASTSFAGKDKFLNQHHYHEVYGREEWIKSGVPESAMNGWGLYDGDLFSRAKTKLRELSASKQKFNLTLLTVDTHEPEGHLSASCAQRGFAGFAGVITCTAAEVADFVRYAKDNGYLEDTNIVILGDHLSRKNPLTEQLEALPDRTIFNSFISAEAPAPNRKQLLHFDLMPTILEFTGFSLADGRMGLGYSGFNAHPLQPPKDRFTDMDKSLMNHSDQYMALWSDAESDN